MAKIYLYVNGNGWKEFDSSNLAELSKRNITIGEGSDIGSRSYIGEGSHIGVGTQIGYDSYIGSRSRIGSRSQHW